MQDSILSTIDHATTLTEKHGVDNIIVTIVVAFITIYFTIQLLKSRKQWNEDSYALKEIKTDTEQTKNVVFKIPTYHWETITMLEQLVNRYSMVFSYDQCLLIASAVINGTLSKLTVKAIEIITENNINSRWTIIEPKLKEMIKSQWQSDMAILNHFIIKDGKELPFYIDQSVIEQITNYLLTAVKNKYKASDIDDSLYNIYRNIIANLTNELKKSLE